MARLTAVLVGNGIFRVANAAGGAMVGFYLAHLVQQGANTDAALLGALFAVANIAELLGAIPLGTLVDRFSPRALLVVSALVGAVATQLFGVSGMVIVFYISRALEGVAAAGSTPAILAHLSDVTADKPEQRGRVMGYFELSILTGLAMGTLVGGALWDSVQVLGFSLLAVVYLVVAVLFFWGAPPAGTPHIHTSPKSPFNWQNIRGLALPWLMANAVVGLWSAHTTFQLTGSQVAGQYLTGRFTATEVGYLSVAYALVFAIGVLIWGRIFDWMTRVRAMQIALYGMFAVSACFFLLNSSGEWAIWMRWPVIAVYAVTIMVQSGFTPAALAYLADMTGVQPGRGTTLGIYSMLLGLGNAIGAYFGGLLADELALNGLLIGTIALGSIGLIAIRWMEPTSTLQH